jgi:tetratricopeptide (TPR) repeat protein
MHLGVPLEERASRDQKAIEIAESSTLLVQAARAHNSLGVLHWSVGNYPQALEHIHRSVLLSRRVGDPENEIYYGSSEAEINILLGNLVQAETLLADLRQVETAVQPFSSGGLQLRVTKAYLQFGRGELQQAAESLQSIWEAIKGAGDIQRMSGVGSLLGAVLLELGKEEEAETVLQTVAEAGYKGSSLGNTIPLALLVMKYIQTRDLDEARSKLEFALGLETDNAEGVFYCSIAKARLLAAFYEWEEAWAVFSELIAMTEKSGIRWWRTRIMLYWAEAHLQRDGEGDQLKGMEMVVKARTDFLEMGAHGWVEIVGKRLQALKTG